MQRRRRGSVVFDDALLDIRDGDTSLDVQVREETSKDVKDAFGVLSVFLRRGPW